MAEKYTRRPNNSRSDTPVAVICASPDRLRADGAGGKICRTSSVTVTSRGGRFSGSCNSGTVVWSSAKPPSAPASEILTPQPVRAIRAGISASQPARTLNAPAASTSGHRPNAGGGQALAALSPAMNGSNSQRSGARRCVAGEGMNKTAPWPGGADDRGEQHSPPPSNLFLPPRSHSLPDSWPAPPTIPVLSLARKLPAG